jgi:hypothetical protein
MDFFLILQVLFDAVLLFGVLFLFHYSVNHSRKKKEESDILNNYQVQEIKENLQELLLTLKQLGKEVSDNIQEQVAEAEVKAETFKKLILILQKDLNKTMALAEEVKSEKNRLEEKAKIIRTSKKESTKVLPLIEDSFLKLAPNTSAGPNNIDGGKILNAKKKRRLRGFGPTVGFSSGLVREIYRLADMDMDVNDIVQKTQLSRAEVQLVLNLRDNRFTTPN